jgi:hypothetical protein
MLSIVLVQDKFAAKYGILFFKEIGLLLPSSHYEIRSHLDFTFSEKIS